MSKSERRFVSVYYEIRTDPKFSGVYGDNDLLAAWLRLLLDADAVYPAPASIPAHAAKQIGRLVEAGLVSLLGDGLFQVNGLARERERRSQSGRNAAAVRWQSGRNADAIPSNATEKYVTPISPGRGQTKRENGENPRAIASAVVHDERWELARQEAERRAELIAPDKDRDDTVSFADRMAANGVDPEIAG